MFIRGVIHHQVDQHAQASLRASVGELHEITQRAVPRIDAVIIGNVIPIVRAG